MYKIDDIARIHSDAYVASTIMNFLAHGLRMIPYVSDGALARLSDQMILKFMIL